MSAMQCECGQPKDSREDGCERCLSLDGEGRAEAVLIAALRTLGGPATMKSLSSEAQLSSRQVLRSVKRLLARGRVRKRVDGEITSHGRNTGELTPATYALVEPRKAARAAGRRRPHGTLAARRFVA